MFTPTYPSIALGVVVCVVVGICLLRRYSLCGFTFGDSGSASPQPLHPHMHNQMPQPDVVYPHSHQYPTMSNNSAPPTLYASQSPPPQYPSGHNFYGGGATQSIYASQQPPVVMGYPVTSASQPQAFYPAAAPTPQTFAYGRPAV